MRVVHIEIGGFINGQNAIDYTSNTVNQLSHVFQSRLANNGYDVLSCYATSEPMASDYAVWFLHLTIEVKTSESVDPVLTKQSVANLLADVDSAGIGLTGYWEIFSNYTDSGTTVKPKPKPVPTPTPNNPFPDLTAQLNKLLGISEQIKNAPSIDDYAAGLDPWGTPDASGCYPDNLDFNGDACIGTPHKDKNATDQFKDFATKLGVSTGILLAIGAVIFIGITKK